MRNIWIKQPDICWGFDDWRKQFDSRFTLLFGFSSFAGLAFHLPERLTSDRFGCSGFAAQAASL